MTFFPALPVLFALVLLVLSAAAFGSFLHLWVWRWAQGQAGSLLWGRSRCDHCQQPLPAWALVPLLSYVWQRGRCRSCGGVIAASHFHAECAASAAALSLVLWAEPTDWGAGAVLALGLLALALIDGLTGLLPDALTVPLLLAGLGSAWLGLGSCSLLDAGLGAVLGGALLALPAWGYRRWRGRDGLGGGDIVLTAAGGSWIGWDALPALLLLASLSGILLILLRAWRLGVGLDQPFRFGPVLALALWVLWLIKDHAGAGWLLLERGL